MVAKKKEDTLTIEDKLKAALVPALEQPHPIPEKWEWTKIGEISSVITGKTPRTADPQYTESDDLFFVTPAAFDMGDQLRFSDRFVANAAAQVAPLIPVKSTLLTSIGATLGKTAILEVPAVINQQINALVPRGIVPDFLFRWTCSQVFQEIMWSKSSATTLPIINKSRCEQLPIPLAPLPEQQRIAEKLESLLGRIEEVKTLLNEVPEILQNFRQTVLAAACSGRLTEDWREKNLKVETAAELLHRVQKARKRRYEEACKKAKEQGTKKPKKDYMIDVIREKTDISSWAEARLDNLIYIAGRIGWRGLKAEEYTEDGPLFLSVYSLNYGEEVDFVNAFHISMERYEESSEIQLQENDILLAKDGAGIGKIGIVRNLDRLATVNSSLLVIRSQEAFIPKFLFYFLSGPQLQEIARARITGSATPHLFQRDIKEFVLSIPPILEQKEIVRRVESLFGKIDDLETQYKEATEFVESLPEVILSKAFRGKLVSQDSNDEPAIKLLERILSQTNLLTLDVSDTVSLAEASIVNIKAGRSNMSAESVKLSLYEVLEQTKGAITPEELFRKAGYKLEDLDDVESFYAALSKEVRTKRIKENRSLSSDVITLEKAL